MTRRTPPRSPAGQQDNSQHSRRSELRTSLALVSGTLTASGDAYPCRVRDVSSRGIKVDCRHLPLPGQRVMIDLPGLGPCAAIAVWAQHGACGLRFETPQGPRRIATLREAIEQLDRGAATSPKLARRRLEDMKASRRGVSAAGRRATRLAAREQRSAAESIDEVLSALARLALASSRDIEGDPA